MVPQFLHATRPMRVRVIAAFLLPPRLVLCLRFGSGAIAINQYYWTLLYQFSVSLSRSESFALQRGGFAQ